MSNTDFKTNSEIPGLELQIKKHQGRVTIPNQPFGGRDHSLKDTFYTVSVRERGTQNEVDIPALFLNFEEEGGPQGVLGFPLKHNEKTHNANIGSPTDAWKKFVLTIDRGYIELVATGVDSQTGEEVTAGVPIDGHLLKPLVPLLNNAKQ